MQTADALKSAEQVFEQAGVPSPRVDAQILLAHVCDVSRTELIALPTLSAEQVLSKFLLPGKHL